MEEAQRLNEFIKLPDGSELEPNGIELQQLIIWDYKQFLSDSQPFVFDMSGPLTTLVGPNGSGKTTILEALRLFCTVIKKGSCCCPLERAKELFGINYKLVRHLIQGVFEIHYHNPDEYKSLRLNVSLIPRKFGSGLEASIYRKRNFLQQCSLQEHDECIHVCITVGQKEQVFSQYERLKSLCPGKNYHDFLHPADYDKLENLFPQVTSFNNRSVLNSHLESLRNEYPLIDRHAKEINEEVTKVFGSVNFWLHSDDRRNNEWGPATLMASRRAFDSEEKGPHSESVHDVAVCGDGVLRCFYLITAIYCTKRHSIITVDEPDAHLFPNAQKLLVEFLYRKMEDFHKQNHFCKMVVTTHSPDIMQALKLEDIRQIFLQPGTANPIEIKSLACAGHLLNVMTDIGASILSHSEFVRLGVHRKLLYLEDHDDYNFFSGIIYRIKPELLQLPFTKMGKGGRTQPSQIKQLIREFRQLLPKTATLHIFVLVDADLRSNSILETEKVEYHAIQNDSKLNVKIYYHCWAVREWENWLLSNEDLLYEMLFDNQLHNNEPTIIQLRDRIKGHWPRSEPTTTVAATTQAPQIPTSKVQFCTWFTNQLKDYFQRLKTKELTSSQMQGTEVISSKDLKELARKAGEEFLRNAGVTDEIMANFGDLLVPIQTSVGFHLQKREIPKQKGPKNNTDKQNDVKSCRAEWLLDRQLQDLIDLNNVNVRKELTKWIDAKQFFHQLTHGEISSNDKIDLDEYWKRAFSLRTTDEYNLYGRYFNSLNSQEWPKDFEVLVEDFERFVNAGEGEDE